MALPRLSRALVVIAFSLLPGCAASTENTELARPSDSPGTRLALGTMGVDAASAPKANQTIGARRYRAVAGYITAEIERRDPGHLDRIAADAKSADPVKVTAAFDWLDAALRDASKSQHVRSAVEADPLFAGAHFQSLDEGEIELRNTGGSGGSGGSSGGSGASDDVPDVGKGDDGKYGDDRAGMLGAVQDAGDLAAGTNPAGLVKRAGDLAAVDAGLETPDPNSRLGAYAATSGYPSGTVGNAVHNAIGTIYGTLGTYGQENIGRVFNSPDAQALYNDPVDSSSGKKMAQIEYNYWQNVSKEDPYSAGGRLGSAFNPTTRDWLQRNVF